MDQDNLAGRLATKRKLAFLKTFDKRIEGLIREKERLEKALEDPDAPASPPHMENVERIVRGLVGAGPVYGINAVSEWAKKTIAHITASKEIDAGLTEEDILWLSSITQELKLLHSEAILDIEERYGLAVIQETPSVIPPAASAPREGRSTLPPENRTTALPDATPSTRVARIAPDRAEPANPISSPPPLIPKDSQITPITEDDIVTSIPEELGADPSPNLRGVRGSSVPRPTPATPEPTAPAAARSDPPAPLPAPRPAPRSFVAAPGPTPRTAPLEAAAKKPDEVPAGWSADRKSAEDVRGWSTNIIDEAETRVVDTRSKEDPSETIPLSVEDVTQLPEPVPSVSAPRESGPPAPEPANLELPEAGRAGTWRIALGITWIALLVSLYFNWQSYVAEPTRKPEMVEAASRPEPRPLEPAHTGRAVVVPKIAIEAPSFPHKPSGEPARAAETAAVEPAAEPPAPAEPAAAPETRPTAETPTAQKAAAPEPPKPEPKKEPADRPTTAKEGFPRSAPPVSQGDTSGVLSVLVPPQAQGPVAVEVDKRPRGNAPIKIKLSPGLHEVVQTYQGKRTMRIVLIRDGKTKIITAKIPD